MPSWFQGQDGVAVQPCVDAARCALVGAPGFNPALAISFPANFPGEAFYFNATANFVMPGASDVLVVMALEYVFADALGNLVPAATPGAVATPFQRLRVRHTFIGGAGSTAAIGISANGTYTVTHPWGITKIPVSSFKCANSGGNTRCTFTRDVPLGGVVNFTAALGNTGFVAPDSGISTFLKDPTAPAGFLGTGAAALSYTGAFPAGNPNSVAITDPLGNTSGPISLLTTLTGQTVGIDLTLPVGGTNSGVVMPTGAVKRTFNINNRTGVAFTPIITANANAPNTTPVVASPDFTIVPSATLPCPTGAATLAIGANCNFDVNFTPIGADGPRTATISITDGPGAVPPAWAVVTGIADGTAPALALTGIAKFTNKASQAISGTATDANGIGAVTVTIDGAAPAAATVTGGTWSFTTGVLVAQDDATGLPVHNIVVNANDTALPAPGNAATSATSTIVVDATPPAVTLTVQGQGTTTKNATPVITFTAADRNLAVTTVKVDGTIITPTPASGAAMATLADGPHVVAVEATDAAGNVKLLAAPTITIDTIVSPFTLTPVTAVTRVKTQTIGGTVEAGSTVNVAIGTGAAAPATVTGTAWTFPANLVEGVNNITVTGADTLGNTGTLPAISIKVVLPDGKITGAASVGIADALKALQFAVGLTQPTAEEALHADVAPLVNGVPAPNDKVDIGDVVVILKKVVDPASW
ncbi:MAG TPA: hypothetical protein VN642_18585 [Dongiaceae bacterium]|nr:hypothetical protein [Dongiaceae bacterium]